MSNKVRLSREQQKADTRARLIDCAHDVFLRNGFHAATLDDIARQAGVTKGAVYSNFASKAELFVAVNGARMDERLRHYRRSHAAVTRLDAFIREYMRTILRDDPDGRWASVVAEASAVAAGDEAFRAALIEQMTQGKAVIGEAIADLAERTGVEFRLPTAHVLKVGAALMRGLLLQRLLDPKDMPKDFIEDVYVAFVQAMVRPRSAVTRLKGNPESGRNDHEDFAAARSGRRASAGRRA
ncbi:MAG TPA: helix-turn-helix domain-containing protein [Vicinamibacterales bacterium]|jgi:AcrR family transcriptional regulator